MTARTYGHSGGPRMWQPCEPVQDEQPPDDLRVPSTFGRTSVGSSSKAACGEQFLASILQPTRSLTGCKTEASICSPPSSAFGLLRNSAALAWLTVLSTIAKIQLMEFGEILRDLRTRAGLGIRRLGPELGVSYTYLSKLENKEIRPSEELVRRVARYFAYDEDQLLMSAGRFLMKSSTFFATTLLGRYRISLTAFRSAAAEKGRETSPELKYGARRPARDPSSNG